MNKNYKLYRDSDLSEDQIEADVASYLGYITPFWSSRFQLKKVNEQLTGADKLFDRFIPLYLQFKVSEGLKPLAFNFTLSSPNLPLQRIRNFRRQNNINTDPTLYFRLRDKAPTATDFQHNILMSLHSPPRQFAFYVAPLTLSIDEYNESLKTSLFDRFFTFDPFRFRDEFRFSGVGKESIGLMPFLRGHVSIPPHELVTTSEHYYSYSKAGTNIAWHSGQKLKGDLRLSTQLINIFEFAYGYRDGGYGKEEYIEFINEFAKTNKLNFNSNPNFPDNTIFEFGYYLKETHDISLMFLGINK